MKCELCDGARTFGALVRRADGCRPEQVTCPACRGTGDGIDYPPHWRTNGATLRAIRNAKDLSLRECARAMGVRVSELSEAETGRRDPSLFLTRIRDCHASDGTRARCTNTPAPSRAGRRRSDVRTT